MVANEVEKRLHKIYEEIFSSCCSMPPRMHPKIQAAEEKLQDPFKEQEILLMSEQLVQILMILKSVINFIWKKLSVF